MIGLLGQAVAQRVERAYCHIVAIEHKRLKNAVQVTIRADGLMATDIRSRDFFNVDAARMGRRDRMGKRVDSIPIRIPNARSQVGSVTYVGVYPVSHVEVTVPPEAAEGIGVELKIVLYKPAMTREIRIRGDRWQFNPEGEAPPFIYMEMSQDRRSLIVIVTSDRRTMEPVERRKPAEVTAETLQVRSDRGLLSVSAIDAPLRAFLAELGKVTGLTFLVDPQAERAVCLWMEGVSLGEILDALSTAYSLAVRTAGKLISVAEALPAGGAAYEATTFETIPLRYISATAARDSLPDMILEHIQVDRERNALTVVGPPALIQKVRQDLEHLDQPVPLTEVRITAVEFTDTETLKQAWRGRLRWMGGDISIGTSGDITYGTLSTTPTDFLASLQSLVRTGRAYLRGESTLTVLNGRPARLFIGRQRRMPAQYFDFWRWRLETRILNVNYGTAVQVVPWTSGEGTILLTVTTELADIAEVDRTTGNPTLARRLAESTVMLPDGDTLLVAGLDTLQQNTQERRIGDGGLPIAGQRTTDHPVMAVFVTARIVKTAAAASADNRDTTQ